MLLHPSFRRLRDYAAGDAGLASGRVAAHLLRCRRCRRRVEEVRRVREHVGSLPLETAPKRFEDIVARRADGERILLPAATTDRPSGRRRGLRHAAYAALVVAGIGLVIRGTPEAGAMRAELEVYPAAPRAGDTLRISYRATYLLSGEDSLLVRARLRTPGSGQRVDETVVFATLFPAGRGIFSGTAALPDSVVLAVLAVESADGERLDAGGELWHVLVHQDDGRPTVHALLQQRFDAGARDTRVYAAIAERLTVLYPERPESWDATWIAAATSLPLDAVDSLSAWHRTQRLPALEARLARMAEPDANALGAMLWYTRRIEAREAFERWKQPLFERYPSHGFTVMWRLADLRTTHAGDRQALLQAYDSVWQELGPVGGQLPQDALALAVALGDVAAVRTWVERLDRTDPGYAETVALSMSRFPELRADAVQRLRAVVDGLLNGPAHERILNHTATQWRERQERRAGGVLFTLGTTLLALADTAAAVEALERAAATGWDTERYRALGETLVAMGDTAAGVQALSRFMVDPVTSRAAADSVRGLLASPGRPDPDWDAAAAQARADMQELTMRYTVRRVPRLARLRLQRPDAREETVSLVDGPVVVVFWSRFCSYSLAQLRSLDRVAAVLAASGVPLIAVTHEPDAAAAAAWLRGAGYSFPTWSDPHRDAENAFDYRGRNGFFVLDASGTIRFAGHAAAAVPRQVIAAGAWR